MVGHKQPRYTLEAEMRAVLSELGNIILLKKKTSKNGNDGSSLLLTGLGQSLVRHASSPCYKLAQLAVTKSH